MSYRKPQRPKKKQRKRKRKQKKAKPLEMKPQSAKAWSERRKYGEMAERVGIDLKCNKAGQTRPTVHAMFDWDGIHLVHWWPSTGKIAIGETWGRQDHADTFAQALGLAIQEKVEIESHVTYRV